jgi:hypothetical protein
MLSRIFKPNTRDYAGSNLSRENVKAAVREARLVLRCRYIHAEQFQFILASIMKQAEAMYEDYPMAM